MCHPQSLHLAVFTYICMGTHILSHLAYHTCSILRHVPDILDPRYTWLAHLLEEHAMLGCIDALLEVYMSLSAIEVYLSLSEFPVKPNSVLSRTYIDMCVYHPKRVMLLHTLNGSYFCHPERTMFPGTLI